MVFECNINCVVMTLWINSLFVWIVPGETIVFFFLYWLHMKELIGTSSYQRIKKKKTWLKNWFNFKCHVDYYNQITNSTESYLNWYDSLGTFSILPWASFLQRVVQIKQNRTKKWAQFLNFKNMSKDTPNMIGLVHCPISKIGFAVFI